MTFQIACVHTHLGDLYTGYLDEAEYDVKNCVGRADSYLPRTKLFLPTPTLFLKLPGCTIAGCNNCFITHSKSRIKARKMLPRCKGPFYKIFPISRQFQDMTGSLFWQIFFVLQMSALSDIIVYSCNDFESVVRLIRFHITC